MGRLSFGFLVLAPLAACAGGSAPEGVDAETVASAGQALTDDGDGLAGADGDAADEDTLLEEARPDGECRLADLRARVVQRYDADGDGVLSDDERDALRDDVEGRPVVGRALDHRRALHRGILKRLRFVYDDDHSGSLDGTERATLKDDLEVRCANRKAQLLEQYDADGSGDLSDTERTQLRTDREERFAARRAALLAQFDANQDGHLGPAEREALRDAARERAQARRAQLKARFDVDGDGHLSDTEQGALREFLRQKIRLEGDGQDDADEPQP